MAELRERFENTVLTLRPQPFPERWARYWSMVLHALDHAPDTLEFLNRLIIDQEEGLADAEGRPTLEDMLGDERAALRKEADDVVTQLLKPFFSSDGTTAEREAVADERRRLRAEIHPHTQRAEAEEAYETYALVLDYTTAFGVASAVAFKASIGVREPKRAAPLDQRAPVAAAFHESEVQPSQEVPQERDEPPAAEPERRPAPEEHRPLPPAEERNNETTGDEPAAGPVHLDRTEPVPPSGPPDAPRTGGGRRGMIAAACIVLGLFVAVGAGYALKPELFDPAFWSAGDQTAGTDDPQPAPQAETQTQAETPVPKPDKNASPLDKFHAAIMNTSATTCPPPEDLAKAKWAEIGAFSECAKSQAVSLVSKFRFMLSQAGGKWLGADNWAAPAGPDRDRLTAAWSHISGLRTRWNSEVKTAISKYGASYFGFQSHGLIGWRFAAWRCRCNLKGEYRPNDTGNVKPRLFITRPALIQSEDEARLAFSQVSHFFVGPAASGDKQAVELGIKNADLPYDLPGGLGMARPLPTQEAAEQAWAEVKALHAGVGFEINELQWASN